MENTNTTTTETIVTLNNLTRYDEKLKAKMAQMMPPFSNLQKIMLILFRIIMMQKVLQKQKLMISQRVQLRQMRMQLLN